MYMYSNWKAFYYIDSIIHYAEDQGRYRTLLWNSRLDQQELSGIAESRLIKQLNAIQRRTLSVDG
jgi:hypothetical protein